MCLPTRGGGPEFVTTLGGLSTNNPKFRLSKGETWNAFEGRYEFIGRV